MSPKQHLKVFVEDKTTGEVICGCGCARVVEEKTFDQGSINFEKNVDNKNLPVRPKATLILHDHNLTTKITSSNYDYLGNKLKPETSTMMHAVRREHRRSRVITAEEGRLAGVLNEIANISSKLDLSDSVKEDACYLARKIENNPRAKGKNWIVVACICLYLAAKRSGSPKSIKIFFPIMGVHKTNILAKTMKIEELMGLEIKKKRQVDEIIYDICRQFRIKSYVRDIAFRFLSIYEKSSECGASTDKVKAAISVYFAVRMYYGTKKGGYHPLNAESLTDYLQMGKNTLLCRYSDLKDLIFQNKEKLLN